MRYGVLLLLLVIFAAACTQGEVTLTASEQKVCQSLKKADPTRIAGLQIDIQKNPQYLSREVFSRSFPNAESAYAAVYESEIEAPNNDLMILTLNFKDVNERNADFKYFGLLNAERKERVWFRILHDGDTAILVWAESRNSAYLVPEISEKLARRLGMGTYELDDLLALP